MTWIKLEDTIPDHDKIVRAGDRASWLWVAGLCWSSRHLKNGKLPYDVVGRLTDQSDAYELADRLVEVGLWRRTKTGFTIHNYAKFQRTKAQVEADRDAAAERQRRVRDRKKSRRDEPVTHAVVTAQETDTETEEISPPTPPKGECEICHGTGLLPSATDEAGGYRVARACECQRPDLQIVAGGAA